MLIVPPAPPKLPEPLPDTVPDDWFGDDDAEAQDRPVDGADGVDRGPPRPVRGRRLAGVRRLPAEDDYLADDGEERRDVPRACDDAGEAEEEPEESEARSPGKEWLVMIGQLAVGVLGGAALWLAFNYLWRAIPAAALVVALAVTVGLVLLVRKIRRADDLQTTVLAVLVGLIVTVSPAAMLLVKS